DAPLAPGGAMPQLFTRRADTIFRVNLLAALVVPAFVVWVCLIFTRSSYGTGAAISHVQPVPFSHEHHVGVLGIDCRYCHTGVEDSSFAGFPPTKTCMNCHSQMWVGSDMLEPVRASYREGKPLRWHRVYNLPGFVYFDHSIHVQKGVGCTTCHGRVDEMPFLYQEPSLLMEWCLDCHRGPEKHLRPRAAVFDVKWHEPADQLERGRKLKDEYGIRDAQFLTSCSVCHR
ncbi:MAG TPA: cytochrome c3 family protein, partial [Gemmataceae bacterium]|nr:cytochrome c3 family protein [Gemmataceae bacterium]